MMDERAILEAGIRALAGWTGAGGLPHATRLAEALVDGGMITGDELTREIGGRNWVLARRTANIVRRYGEDVICLTAKKLAEAEMRALEARLTKSTIDTTTL